jgi:DNA-binding NarL/FixJ family response regulator
MRAKPPERSMSSTFATASDAIGVLVADSHKMQSQLLVSALRRRPEFQVISCPMDMDLVLKAITASEIKVALMITDHHNSGLQDMATVRRVHLAYPEIAKVVLVESYNREVVVNTFRSGARGLFCFTKLPFRALCKCIHRVASGQVWANTEQLNYLIEVVTPVPSLRVVNTNGEDLLTPREEQVVALVAEGLSNRDVAQELKLSEHTVKKYLFRIFDKLGISTRVELVLYAVNHGDTRPAEWVAGSG